MEIQGSILGEVQVFTWGRPLPLTVARVRSRYSRGSDTTPASTSVAETTSSWTISKDKVLIPEWSPFCEGLVSTDLTRPRKPPRYLHYVLSPRWVAARIVSAVEAQAAESCGLQDSHRVQPFGRRRPASSDDGRRRSTRQRDRHLPVGSERHGGYTLDKWIIGSVVDRSRSVVGGDACSQELRPIAV